MKERVKRIKIEHDVPIPNGRWYAEIMSLNKHGSFVFPHSEFTLVRHAIAKIKRRYVGRKFKTMRISETERRIWRK